MPTPATAPWFTAEHQQGLEDFWRVYEGHYDQIHTETLKAVARHPEFIPMISSSTPAQLAEQSRESRARLGRAIAGDWEQYRVNLRAQGAMFARLEISFAGWSDATRAFQTHLIPLLISELGTDPLRLGGAISAMIQFTDHVMATISDSYLAEKEVLLAAQTRLSQASEERYRLLFDRSPMPKWVYDVETLAFLAVNDAAIRNYGYSREQFLKMTIKDIRSPDELPALAEDLATQGAKDKRVWQHLKKDGSKISVEIHAHSVVFDGRPARLVLANDISERKLLEEQLRQSQKMEAVGRLAGGIAHDFNNLLSVILSYSGTLVDSLATSDPMRADLLEISRAGERAARLTRQLLAFSRQQVLAPAILDLNGVLAGIDNMVRRLIGEDVELATLPAKGLKRMKADPGQLEQVLINLVLNARDAMPKGGKLTIETANVDLDEGYANEHLGARKGPHVMLAVSDTGTGMDKATQSRIFEPFFTTKEQGKGTGLGLSTVFGIVKQSGGNIWVYSELGKGTTFKLFFPSTEELVPIATRASAVATPRGTETILLVEDDDQVRSLVKGILSKHGYAVLEARNGAEAVGVCERHPEPIQLLLTDVVMPGISGPELARTLMPLRPKMKVLCMSGYTDEAILHHGLLGEGIAFMQKPITPELLTHRIREVLAAP